ncbi:MAG: glutamate racemase [Ruminococcaceae bacterium]|nr:glutamate racemase [Oscillospiraceae bacterium]
MIGVFDSGMGGLTAIKQIVKMMPNEDIVYFGDTGRVPYGTRSKDTIIKYACQDVRFLLSKNVDAILIACGTVSANAISVLREQFDVPIFGVVEAAADKAVRVTKNKTVGIIGTNATVKSGAYTSHIKALDQNIKTVSTPCPLFVPLVENGFTDANNEITRLTCEHYLSDIKASGADTLILGCTHYPIIAPVISKVLPCVELVNTGAEAAVRLFEEVKPMGGTGKIEYYVSDDVASFKAAAELFLEMPVGENVFKVDIEKY